MADYISRDKAVAIFEALKNGTLEDGNRMAAAVWKLSAGIVSRLPAADVEPVRRGRWIEYPAAHYYKCSECRYTVPYRKAALMSGKRQYNYCPNCGAKMDGGNGKC